MRKIVTVLGARPQFIKASVVSHVIASEPALTEVIVHTGQHFDANMSDVFFAELDIARPDYFLGVHGGNHGVMTGRMLELVEEVLLSEKPDIVLVYGDTNSTLAGALAAVKLRIPVAHVEAGLRSLNMDMPEEINRILTDRISRWLFTPTARAREHLLREGFAAENIVMVGDVMYDVALHYGQRIQADKSLIAKLGLTEQGYVLATVHRAENTDHPERLGAIIDGLAAVAQNIPVVMPLHPRTRAALQKIGRFDSLAARIQLIDPVGYLEMVQLEKFAGLIATDSGGVQKEAFFYHVPCVTLRDETEWVELVEAGWNRLTPPTDAVAIQKAIEKSLVQRGKPVQPYGTGDAAQRIVANLMGRLES